MSATKRGVHRAGCPYLGDAGDLSRAVRQSEGLFHMHIHGNIGEPRMSVHRQPGSFPN